MENIKALNQATATYQKNPVKRNWTRLRKAIDEAIGVVETMVQLDPPTGELMVMSLRVAMDAAKTRG